MTLRKTTFFEKAILLIGVFIAIFGIFIFTNPAILLANTSVLIVILLWLILIGIIIVMAIGEDIKEELAVIMKDETGQLKTLKEIAHDQLQEIRLLTEINIAEKKNLSIATIKRVRDFHERLEASEKLKNELTPPQ